MNAGTIFFTVLTILVVIYTVVELAYGVKQYVNNEEQSSESTEE